MNRQSFLYSLAFQILTSDEKQRIVIASPSREDAAKLQKDLRRVLRDISKRMGRAADVRVTFRPAP